MRERFRQRATRRQVTRLIQAGVGVHEASWDPPADDDERGIEGLTDTIITWVREAMGTMRRPYGIDQVSVALTCKAPGGEVVCSDLFGVVRPAEFYGEPGQDRVRAFLGDAVAVPALRRGEIVAAVLSLGDLAYAMDVRHAV